MNDLIYTKTEKCIGCNRCIDDCPSLTANVSEKVRDDNYVIRVNNNECSLCGTCFGSCQHDAREYVDDCCDFFAQLKEGKEFSVIAAPSFYINYPTQYKKIFGYLKSLGVKDFYPVGFGADITVWAYLDYLIKSEINGHIAQPCPSIVLYIERYLPELIPKLMPIQSPMMCLAIYLKKYLGIKEELVFISPCISKKIEIQSKRGRGLVTHNVTFKTLMEYIRHQDVVLDDYPEADYTIGADMGSLFPLPGGLRENIEFYLGRRASVITIEGERESYRYLDRRAKDLVSGKSDSVPSLIDILNCSKGCVCGTGTEFRGTDDYDVSHNAVEFRRQNSSDIKVVTLPADRLGLLNERFKDLRIEDFMCEYLSDIDGHEISVTDAEIDEILENELLKLTENNKHLDCSACGYRSCRSMAKAIALGINHQENCVYYVKQVLNESTAMMEQRLKAMLNASPMLCAIFNEHFEISEVNEYAAKLLKLSDKQEYVDRFFELSTEYQPDGKLSRDKAPMLVKRAIESGMGYVPEWTHITHDGDVVPVEVFLRRVELNNKCAVIVYARDLRDERKMLLRLRSALDREQDANHKKTKFLSSMSHEIRTPMNSVLGIAQLQLQRDDNLPETEEAFLRIYSASKLLLTIINDILDISMVESGKIEITHEPYDTASMIVDTIQLNLMNIGSKKIDFVLDVDENLPENLIGDEVRVKQILNNVISNAIKYTGKGFVKVSFAGDTGNTDSMMLTVTVTDSGQGMTKEQVNALFGDEFTRFNLQHNRSIEGSGLGLIISHRLTTLMDGSISVESEQGKGSKFVVSLPQMIQDDKVLGSNVVASLRNFEYPHNTVRKFSKIRHEPMPYGRVLVVDDVESNLYVAKEFLKPYKLIVETVDSGIEAISKLEAGDVFDIIFMDHMMPDMDGIEATKIIRGMGYDHPIIALSANALIDSSQIFMNNGFSGFLSKPIISDQLDKYLIQFIRNKQPRHVIEQSHMSYEPDYMDAQSEDSLQRALVESFLRDAIKSADVIEGILTKQKFNAEALKAYTVRTHAMKSALLNIGEEKISLTAGILENAGRNSDVDVILEKTPGFLDSLRAVISGLSDMQQEQDLPEEDEDPEFLHKQLLVIRTALNSYDIDTADTVLEALRDKKCSKQTTEFLSTIADHLLCGEFDEISELISRTISG